MKTERMKGQEAKPVKKKTKARCITCNQKVQALGLCSACRREAKARIARGEITEERLVELGLMQRRKTAGRPKRENGMARALSSIVKGGRK